MKKIMSPLPTLMLWQTGLLIAIFLIGCHTQPFNKGLLQPLPAGAGLGQTQSPPVEKQTNHSATAVTHKPSAAINYNTILQKSEDEILDDVAKLPDKDINIGFVALLLAKGFYPEVDVPKYLKELDEMAEDLQSRINGQKDPEKIIRAINFYIYEIKGMRIGSTTREQAYQNEDKESFLNRLLDTNRGNCNSLSTLYLSLAERLDIPLFPVEIPSHIFVRYDDGNFRRNIETTDFGNENKDEAYLKYPEIDGHKLLPEDIENFGYLKNKTKKDVANIILRTRSKCFHIRGNPELAEQDWAKLIRLSLNPAEAYNFIGNQLSYYLVQKDQDKALEWMNKAVALCPDNYVYYFDRGRIYGEKNDMANALRDFNKAIELAPAQPSGYFSRSRVYYLTKEYEKALADAEKNIELKPDEPTAWTMKGASLLQLNRPDEALKAYDKAIELKPAQQTAWHNKGRALRDLDRYDEALAAFDKSLQINPNYAATWYSRAILYTLMKDKSNALKNLAEAIGLDTKYKEKAQKDEDFKGLWEDEEFKKITE